MTFTKCKKIFIVSCNMKIRPTQIKGNITGGFFEFFTSLSGPLTEKGGVREFGKTIYHGDGVGKRATRNGGERVRYEFSKLRETCLILYIKTYSGYISEIMNSIRVPYLLAMIYRSQLLVYIGRLTTVSNPN
jgi:hypothetical protein